MKNKLILLALLAITNNSYSLDSNLSDQTIDQDKTIELEELSILYHRAVFLYIAAQSLFCSEIANLCRQFDKRMADKMLSELKQLYDRNCINILTMETLPIEQALFMIRFHKEETSVEKFQMLMGTNAQHDFHEDILACLSKNYDLFHSKEKSQETPFVLLGNIGLEGIYVCRMINSRNYNEDAQYLLSFIKQLHIFCEQITISLKVDNQKTSLKKIITSLNKLAKMILILTEQHKAKIQLFVDNLSYKAITNLLMDNAEKIELIAQSVANLQVN